MTLTVHLAPTTDVPDVRYRWDPDTDILSASVDAPLDPPGAPRAHGAVRETLAGSEAPPGGGAGSSGAIEVQGTDGSWLSLELVHGRIAGVQVAVWPSVRRRAGLTAPAAPACVAFAVEPADAPPARGPVALELSARVAAESDPAERLFHFVFGPPRPTERARIARDLVLEVDERRRLAGLWLLNVPPFPDDT